MHTHLPLVSVIMPVHNAGRFLVPAIESILKQTYRRIEFILVDDQSTDGSLHIIKKYINRYPKRIRIYRTPKKLNAAGNGATDIGLSHARGTFIARMDADDIAYPKRIERQVAYLLSHPTVIMVGSQAVVIDQRGRNTGTKTVPIAHKDIYRAYGFIHPMIHPSIMVRRSMLPNSNRLYSHTWGVNDDYFSFFKLLSYGEFANVPEALLKYRVHNGNASLGDIKQTIKNTIGIRIEAVTRLGYRLTFPTFAAMVAQGLMATLLPSRILNTLYPIVRGMKRPAITFPAFSFPPAWAKMKQYALPLR